MKQILPAILTNVLLAATTAAQGINGRVVDDSGQPLAAVFVSALDSAGHRIAGVLTDNEGRYRLGPLPAGRAQLHADRIGFRSFNAGNIIVPVTGSTNQSFALLPEAFRIEAIQVSKERKCVVRPAQGLQTAYVWDQVRKALTVASWAARRQNLKFDFVRFVQLRDPSTLQVLNDSTHSRVTRGALPFVSAKVSVLTERGYIQQSDSDTFFFAPDADVILSDQFLDTHCFQLEADSTDRQRIGLTFSPVRNRRLPEVRGTLWWDRSKNVLDGLDYTYTSPPAGVEITGAGGHLEFDMLPSGLWVVRRWYVRMPQAVNQTINWFGSTRTESRIRRFRDEGGEIRAIYGENGTLLRSYAPTQFVRAPETKPSPPTSTTLRELCPPPRSDTLTAAVGSFADGKPDSVSVSLQWSRWKVMAGAGTQVTEDVTRVELETDGRGYFWFCALPLHQTITIRVQQHGQKIFESSFQSIPEGVIIPPINAPSSETGR